METWRKVWREGFAPGLSIIALRAVRQALLRDDPRLMQGATTTPPPMQSVLDWPVETACLIGYGAWQGDGHETVGAVDEYFARACYEADCRLGEPAACRWFLNWYDETPRTELRREMVVEVNLALARAYTDGHVREYATAGEVAAA